jgi:hypothetical protein
MFKLEPLVGRLSHPVVEQFTYTTALALQIQCQMALVRSLQTQRSRLENNLWDASISAREEFDDESQV